MKVKDLMIPVAECPRVSVDRSIYDAIVMLEANRDRFKLADYRPRVLLVEDERFRIIGSVRHSDMLKALLGSSRIIGSEDLSMDDQIKVCRDGFDRAYFKAKEIRMKSIVRIPSEIEFIDQDASLEEGACRLLSGSYLHLFAQSQDTVTGIIRLSDLFSSLCHDVKMAGPR